MKSAFRKAVAVAAAVLFLFEQLCFAAPRSSGQARPDTLSPTSRFKPLVSVEKADDGSPVAIITPEEESDVLPDALSRENAEFMYLAVLISRVINRFGDAISAEGLSRLISEDLPELGTSAAYDTDRIYRDRGSYCVPYGPGEDGEMILRFYPEGSGFSGTAGEISVSDEEDGGLVYV
ncbi:MAG: hypothetical protein GF392_05875, partial [Candidatus Omnitrophica bacterium]|nr:hypothetical protein [Candidatus Omnitrophota bacterium]